MYLFIYNATFQRVHEGMTSVSSGHKKNSKDLQGHIWPLFTGQNLVIAAWVETARFVFNVQYKTPKVNDTLPVGLPIASF